jgi:hypothetical protein
MSDDVLTTEERELVWLSRELDKDDPRSSSLIAIIDRLASELAIATSDEGVCERFEARVRRIMGPIPLSLTVDTDENGGIGAVFDGASGEHYAWTPTMYSCLLNLEEQLAKEDAK